MSWVPILALAVLVFIAAAFFLKLPKAGWTTFGAALLFGLAGYALQGEPGKPAAPKDRVAEIQQSNFALIEARRSLFGADQPSARWVTVADGFTRKGQFADAADLLRNAVAENPRDAEAWVALGNVLIEHADGMLTPAALYAYERAERIDPGNPAAAYFTGFALLRAGQPGQTRAIWADILENAPEDAPWREELAGQLERLDQMLGQVAN